MRVYLFMFFLLTIGCVENKEQKIENIKIDKELAEELVSLSIKCVDQKYPYKIGYRFVDKNWVKPHYEITPSFYGCWDWHSAVHGHWAMVKILKDFPEISDRDIILSKLEKILARKISKRSQIFSNKILKKDL